MADVARAAGVSQQTVSRVANGLPNVNEQTRQRVQAAMQELGFRPSYAGRSLRDGRYHSVGLCVNDVTKFGNLSMIDGIASAAREHNCAITLVEMSKTEEFSLAEATRRMAALPVDGIIIGMSRMAPDFETFDPLPGIGTVIVTMYAHPRVTTVDSDHYGCSLLLMDHLFELGHEQIRYIGGPSFSVDEQFRRAGWQDALERKHIEPVEPLEGDWSANSGYEAGRYLAEHDRTMTAIYAANDQMANGVIAALRDSGLRVPEDVSVVGVDDSLDDFVAHNDPLPGIGTVIVTMYAHPRVTTVDSDHYGCSLLLMDHLFELGHEQIRYIGGPSFSVDEQFRRAGWQDALERKHIEPVEPLEGDWSANSGYEAGRYLAEHDRTMTAIYAANDQMANGVIAALRDSGLRVPEDVSVVGVDDSLDDFVAHNELTTVRFDLHQRGREVFEHAVPKAGATDKTVAIRIPGQLIVRHSTAEPRA